MNYGSAQDSWFTPFSRGLPPCSNCTSFSLPPVPTSDLVPSTPLSSTHYPFLSSTESLVSWKFSKRIKYRKTFGSRFTYLCRYLKGENFFWYVSLTIRVWMSVPHLVVRDYNFSLQISTSAVGVKFLHKQNTFMWRFPYVYEKRCQSIRFYFSLLSYGNHSSTLRPSPPLSWLHCISPLTPKEVVVISRDKVVSRCIIIH